MDLKCPADPSHGTFTKEALGYHIAGTHPELTQGQIMPIPTSHETTAVQADNVVTKTIVDLDKVTVSNPNPVIDPMSIGVSPHMEEIPATKKAPLTPEPVVLQYKYSGRCPKCGLAVKTLVLEVGKPKETHTIALCDDHGQLDERTVAKL
jgi:hypothetical protein